MQEGKQVQRAVTESSTPETSNSNLTVLDCTLRDGGYYNNWDFDPDLVSRYLNALPQTGIQVVEVGFRSFPKSGFHGPYVYSRDPFLNQLEIPSSLSVAVMVDAKTILASGLEIDKAVDQLFSDTEQSIVQVVRVAAHISQVQECEALMAALKGKGYLTCLNMMQAGGRSLLEIEKAAQAVDKWNSVDVLYFADSMGNMSASDVEGVTTAIRSSWNRAIGFHAHNNMGKANANCFKAMESGVTWIDVTVTGMGRGAGNAQTEILLSELAQSGFGNYQAEPLYELALADFGPMQKRMGWGTNFAYHYSAIHGVHPTFAQELLSDPRYSPADIVSALNFLAKSDSASFDSRLVQRAFDETYEHDVGGEWNAENWCQGEDVLLLGAGPGLKKYATAIESFVRERKIKALSLNYHEEFSDENIYGYAAADSRRLALDAKRYHQVKKPLFTPARLIPSNVREALSQLDVKDYDLKVVPDKFAMYPTGCEIPSRLTVAYAIGLCSVGGAKRIFLVGFDGYAADDHRQSEMVRAFEIIKEALPQDFLVSLTPTTYPLTQGSIFAPY